MFQSYLALVKFLIRINNKAVRDFLKKKKLKIILDGLDGQIIYFNILLKLSISALIRICLQIILVDVIMDKLSKFSLQKDEKGNKSPGESSRATSSKGKHVQVNKTWHTPISYAKAVTKLVLKVEKEAEIPDFFNSGIDGNFYKPINAIWKNHILHELKEFRKVMSKLIDELLKKYNKKRELKATVSSLISTIEYDVKRLDASSKFGFYEKLLEILNMNSNNPDLVKIKRIKIHEEVRKTFLAEVFEVVNDKLHSTKYNQIFEKFWVHSIYL
ncbi:hypothetical protein ACH5RR_007197 [Cinchona calisaya]|uniref:Uncharacterized protein n=1 Tax=Cinchona calisaya TaxID=153742 RepID=A0ABD3ARI0_9GENT